MKRNVLLSLLLFALPASAWAQNVVSTVRDTGDAVFYSFTEALRTFMAFIPALLGALVILVIGWIVSAVLAKLIAKGLKMIGVDRAVQTAGLGVVLERTRARWTTSDIVALMVKWFIRLIFIQAAANILRMPQITTIINSIVLFIPNVIVAIAIIVLGSLAARLLSQIVEGSLQRSEVENSRAIGLFTKYVVIGFAVVAAINQLGIAEVVVNTFYIALLGSIALAVGLAFGLGGREVAAELTRSWYQGGRSVAEKVRRSDAHYEDAEESIVEAEKKQAEEKARRELTGTRR